MAVRRFRRKGKIPHFEIVGNKPPVIESNEYSGGFA
jgi:hypothetical protein